jgi:hypothetical protein
MWNVTIPTPIAMSSAIGAALLDKHDLDERFIVCCRS